MTDAPLIDERARVRAGAIGAFLILTLYGSIALTVDVPAAAGGFRSDEATYYLIGQSLARDGDLEYRRDDLQRAWAEYPHGPQGVFLKKGQDVEGIRLVPSVPFLDVVGGPDPAANERLYYGKSFIYPAFAAPFVWLFGTNGFLLFNAVLLTLAFGAAYAYLSARMRATIAALTASAFTFASVVPVYFVMIMPELFNYTLGVVAYFFWLHKEGRGDDARRVGLLYGPVSDVIAAVLIGIATFSKITNILLLGPMVLWLLWRRQWRTVALVSVACVAVVSGLFAANTVSSGDWNYQGGERSTFYREEGFPFQTDDRGFAVGDVMARNEALGSVLFDRDMFWHNLRANLAYFFVGRYSGLVAYFFPGLVAMLLMFAAPRRRTAWQWLVFAGLVAQMLVFIITQPYTYFGSGGSIGNRYFLGVYGTALFLLPALQRPFVPVVMWVVGALFMAKLVMNPFYTTLMPYKHAVAGPFRLLPVELTNINDIPTNTNSDQTRIWYGDLGDGDPGFQLYYVDDNVYLRELDKSFWVRGESRGELLMKTDRPYSVLELTLRAGPVPAHATVHFRGRDYAIDLASPGATQRLVLDLGPGFAYQKEADQDPKYIWELAITAGKGFVPQQREPASHDVRYLGVNVTPKILR